MVVSRAGSRPAVDAAGILFVAETSGDRGWDRSRAGVATCAAAFLRLSHVGARGGFAEFTDAAGARGYRDDADLYARAGGEVAEAG